MQCTHGRSATHETVDLWEGVAYIYIYIYYIYIYIYMYGILLQLIPQLVVNYPTGDANGCCTQPELLQSLQRVTECSLTAWARRENI